MWTCCSTASRWSSTARRGAGSGRSSRRHTHATLPVLPLYFRATPYVFPKWLKGVTPTGHQYPTTLWIEEWRAEE